MGPIFRGKFVVTPPLTDAHWQAFDHFKAENHTGTPPGRCKWAVAENGAAIKSAEEDKNYYFREWIVYVVEELLAPLGYVLSVEVTWEGDYDNFRAGGVIYIQNNRIEIVEDEITNSGPSWNRKPRAWRDGKYQADDLRKQNRAGPYVLQAGEGVSGFGASVKAGRVSTGGSLTLIESRTKGGAPLHVHAREEEYFYVI
ncbi:MAG TPA: hypothetical protein VKU00_29095 [Chthonomonadaceae bacterium]|nr:hypothetical protein [Chthonomonadaceae bacterium]